MPAPRGFTLIELLIAVTLLGVVSLLAYRGLDGMHRAGARVEAEHARWQAIARCVDRFGFDVRQPSPRRSRRGGVDQPAWLGQPQAVGENGAQLVFTRKPLVAGQDEQRIGYRLRDGRVELLTWTALDTLSAGDDRPRTYTLLDGVGKFELRYLTPANQWSERWPLGNADALPRAVSLRLVMVDGADLTRIFALP
jgi:general secretion pathway protein J